jgi:hypothetical protein
MRVIIAGSRNINSMDILEKAIDLSGFSITEVISGGARGVDTLGENWATDHGITFKRFPALWGDYGRSAGYKRNVVMAQNADALIALWNGSSKGTKHMIDIAKKQKLKVFVHEIQLCK